MTLGTNLKDLRNKAGLTQKELAEKASVSATYVMMIEKNSRPRVSLDVVMKIAQALNVSLCKLTGDYHQDGELSGVVLPENMTYGMLINVVKGEVEYTLEVVGINKKRTPADKIISIPKPVR